MKRRTLTAALFATVATLVVPMAAQAQDYPTKPMRLVVPFPPGGFVDGLARAMAPGLTDRLGQQIIIENKGGAGGTIGTAQVARAPADGYQLLMVFDTHAVNPFIYKNLPFDTLKDLAPVSRLVENPLVLLAHPSVPANSVRELVELAKQQPKVMTYASVGAGSSNHLTSELFADQAGVEMTHVPYRGGGPAQTDLLGGQVKLMFLSSSLAIPHVKAGKLKALGVTSAARIDALPDVPTLVESGFPGFVVASWIGLLAPAGTPQAIVDRWQAESARVLQSPELLARFATQGISVVASGPAEFDAFLRGESEKWGALIRDKNISID